MLAPTSKILKPATFYKKIGASDAKPAPTWWGMVDSNHRRHCQQIYSLSPLATREIPHMQYEIQCSVELVDGFEPPTC